MPHSTIEKRHAWAKTYVPAHLRWLRWERPGIADVEKIRQALALMYGGDMLPKDIAEAVGVDVVQIHFLYLSNGVICSFIGTKPLFSMFYTGLADILSQVQTPADLRKWRVLVKYQKANRGEQRAINRRLAKRLTREAFQAT